MMKKPETPPRTRGRLKRGQQKGITQRNTPANAGQTGQDKAAVPRGEKHPRERGADYRRGGVTLGTEEKHPRERGADRR